MVEKLMTRLNGNAPGITLMISLIGTVGMGAGWVYQLKANDKEIEVIKAEYCRKDISDAQYRALESKLDALSASLADIQRYLMERDR